MFACIPRNLLSLFTFMSMLCFECFIPTWLSAYIVSSLFFRMSDRGKAIATTSKKRKRSKTSTPSPYANYAKNPLNDEEKENQLLPSTDPTKFPNLYCELRFQKYRTTKLNTGKKLLLPNDVRRRINGRILELGIDFVDRDLGDINISWVCLDGRSCSRIPSPKIY